MIRRPPRSTPSNSSAASDVYKRQGYFKKGAFQLADDLQLPVVPLTIIGSFNILPRTGGFISWHPMTLVVHKPIYPQSQGMENIKATMEEAYREIEKDLPEKYQGKIDNPDQDR